MKRKLITAAIMMIATTCVYANHPLLSREHMPERQISGATIPSSMDQAAAHIMHVASELIVPELAEMELGQFGRLPAHASLDHAERLPDGTVIWSGSVHKQKGTPGASTQSTDNNTVMDERNHVLLVNHDGKVTGNIKVDGKEYRIRPVGDHQHTVTEVDPSKLPQLSHDDAVPYPGGPSAHTHAATLNADGTATIRVLIAYGARAERLTNDHYGLAALAVARANEGFRNSGIDIHFELASVLLMRQDEYRDIGMNLEWVTRNGDGFMDAIHQSRNDSRADIVTLVAADSGGCGLGYLNPNEGGAFNVVDFNCFQGDNVFAHEAGHNMGAQHDPANAGNGTHGAYPYGYGYQNYAVNHRTVMAYPCSGTNCDWGPIWSTPYRLFNGSPMGNTHQSHNARVLQERRFTVANFR
ncbi:zinc-dependent metalloprotease family protein [Dyella sp.]|uniref:zinc-dependent metalloprotease family protein n=1 Tax=Dyella sp. TaxID=1869338 RepID=UPI002ED44C6C